MARGVRCDGDPEDPRGDSSRSGPSLPCTSSFFFDCAPPCGDSHHCSDGSAGRSDTRNVTWLTLVRGTPRPRMRCRPGQLMTTARAHSSYMMLFGCPPAQPEQLTALVSRRAAAAAALLGDPRDHSGHRHVGARQHHRERGAALDRARLRRERRGLDLGGQRLPARDSDAAAAARLARRDRRLSARLADRHHRLHRWHRSPAHSHRRCRP